MATKWGEAAIEMVADYKGIQGDVDKSLTEALSEGDAAAKKSGKKWGAEAADGLKEQLGDELPDALDVATERVRRKKVKLEPDLEIADGSIAKMAVKAGEELVDGLMAGANSNAKSNKVTQSMKDLIGGIFNISGKSPLTTVLIPALVAIPGLAVAAATALQGLTAAATITPAAISGLVASVLTLKVAFSGLESQIGDAFKGKKNLDEFKASIDMLSPPVQNFMYQVRDLGSWFRSLRNAVQITFFTKFGDTLSQIQASLGPTVITGMTKLAGALGTAFAKIGDVISGPVMGRFIGALFNITAQITEMLTPSVTHLINSFAAFGTELLRNSKPFVDILNRVMTDLALFLNEVGQSDDFQSWLAEGASIFSDLYDLLKAIGGLIATLFSQAGAAGGQGLLQFLTETVTTITGLLSGEGGRALMAGFIAATKMAIMTLVGLGVIIGTIIAAVAELGIALGMFVNWLQDKWDGLWSWAANSFMDFALSFNEKVNEIRIWWNNLVDTFKRAIRGMGASFSEAKDQVTGYFSSAKHWLYDAGRNVINGFINGVKAMLPDLKGNLQWITSHISDWKGPETVDRKLLTRAGKLTIGGYIDGIKAQVPALQDLLGTITAGVASTNPNQAAATTSIGPGAVIVNVSGTDQNSAIQAGRAAGSALMRVVTDRAPLLAARTA